MKRVVWTNVLRGVVLLALGVALLCTPEFALSSMAFLLGLTVVVAGVRDIVMYIHMRRHIGGEFAPMLIKGTFGLLAGAMLLSNPRIGTWILNVVVPLGFIAYFTFRMASYGFFRRITGKAVSILILCLNTLGLMLGIVMLFNPMLFTISFGMLAAVILIVLGVSRLCDAWGRHEAPDTVYSERVWRI